MGGLPRLQGEEAKELRLAVQDACGTPAQLRMLVEEDCNQRYDDIVPANATFAAAVFQVIQEADRTEWVEEFIKAALKGAPRNTKLLAWMARYRPAAEGGPTGLLAAVPSPTPVAASELSVVLVYDWEDGHLADGIARRCADAGLTVADMLAAGVPEVVRRVLPGRAHRGAMDQGCPG